VTFADFPIRRKLLTMVLVITAVTLTASAAVLVAFDVTSFRRDLVREFGTLAEVIAANSSATLAFDATDDASDLLQTLAAERSVTMAVIYDVNGKLFAAYAPQKAAPPRLDPRLGKSTHAFQDGSLVTSRPIQQNGKFLGTLVMYTDLRWYYQRLGWYAFVGLSVVALAFCAAMVFSKMLRKSITGPIDELSRVAELVSAKGEFSTRARKFGDDELGALTATFNHMLSQIQLREAELRESEEQRLIALDAAGLGTWRFNRAADAGTRDASLNALLGLNNAETSLHADEWFECIFPEDRARVREAFLESPKAPTEIDLEYRIVRPDESIRWVRDRGRAISNETGRHSLLAGVVMDITERKASEAEVLRLNADLERRVQLRTAQLEDSNRNLEAFAYSVSHDLRAPLRIISGYSEVLLEDRGENLPPDHKLCLSRIVDGTRKMNRLIDDLLQFSRLGQQPIKLQTTSFEKLTDELVADLDREIGTRKVVWNRPPLPEVLCDPGLMRQVMANLLSNALKYSRPRDPAIIEVGATLNDEYYTFFVRDNGVGFDSNASSRLFGVFQRLHSAQEFEGNGVGLATAARIVRRHGGRIWAESKPDQGATFFFTLPVAPDANAS